MVAFAKLTAIQYTTTLTLYPASDQFEATYPRVNVAELQAVLPFERARLENGAVVFATQEPYRTSGESFFPWYNAVDKPREVDPFRLYAYVGRQ